MIVLRRPFFPAMAGISLGLLATQALTGCETTPEETASPTPTVTAIPPTPTANATATAIATTATPEPTPVENCDNLEGVSWVESYSDAELTVRYADVQPRFGECVAVQIVNDGGEKSAFAAYLELGVAIDTFKHFEGTQVELSGTQLALRSNPGETLAAGGTAQACYCSDPARAYPITGASVQWFPAGSSATGGAVFGGHTFRPGTIRDSSAGIVLNFAPIRDPRGAVDSCASLTFTNTTSGDLNIDKADITLNGSGVTPTFWPDFVTGTTGGSSITIDFPSAWSPLAAGKSIPLSLCLSGRMPMAVTYSLK